MNSTDGLTADISIGGRIDIQFTQEIKGDATGYDPYPLNPGLYFNPAGTASASSVSSSSYIADYAFNGSTSNYWHTASCATAWIKVDLLEPTWTAGFGWYMYAYYAKTYDVYGSDDDVTWTKLYSGTMSATMSSYANVATWSPVKYRYYKWDFTSLNSSYMAIYYIKLLSAIGNEGAFTITGQEYQYVGGPLITKTYALTDCDFRYADLLTEIDIETGTMSNTEISQQGDLKLGRAT